MLLKCQKDGGVRPILERVILKEFIHIMLRPRSRRFWPIWSLTQTSDLVFIVSVMAPSGISHTTVFRLINGWDGWDGWESYSPSGYEIDHRDGQAHSFIPRKLRRFARDLLSLGPRVANISDVGVYCF